VLVAALVSSPFLLPALAVAHAELVRAIPADGETVTEPVTYVSGRYSQGLTSESSLDIIDPGGTTIATGGVDPDDARVMVARPDAPLVLGTYIVRSTAISAEDGDIERVTWTFTVAVPATPSPTQAPSGSAPPPSIEPSPTASPATGPTPSPSAAPSGPATSVSDVALPIVAALAIVLIGTGALLYRGRRPGAP
jgi:copper resistance protein C